MKQLIKNYSFNAGAKTITLTDFSTIRLDRILLITNVTANTLIYQFNNQALGGSVSSNILTLTYNTSSMNNSDSLQIIYDSLATDPVYDSQPIGGNVASGTTDSGNPVKMGGKYNATVPTLLDGQRGDLQLDPSGRLLVSPAPLSSGTDTVGVAGIQASGSTVPSNPVYVGFKGAAGNLQPFSSVGNSGNNGVNADAILASSNFIYNGTNTEMVRSANAINNTTGTGVPAAGVVGFDGTNYRRLAVDSSGVASTKGSLTHNNAAPSASNMGVLPALANASTPTFIEGDQVLLSTDLSGKLRLQGVSATGSSVPSNAMATGAKGAAGNLQLISTAGNAGSIGVNLDVLLAIGNYVHNGTNAEMLRTPNTFKTSSITASGDTAHWTPTASKKFRLMRYRIQITGNATAVSGVLSITFKDGGTSLNIVHDVYLTTTALGGAGYDSGWNDLGNGILSATGGNILNVNLSGSLTAGNVRIVTSGVEE